MATPSLSDLPPPPDGRTGWPWTKMPPEFPTAQSNGDPWPKVSIVTPSYNQGQFIEETIRSVLLQGYPNVEYVVMDGGSTDETVGILKKYDPWIDTWESRPDDGQSDAINRGFRQTSGEIYNWLNSDDLLEPGALNVVGRLFSMPENIDWLTGARVARLVGSDIREIQIPWRHRWPRYLLNLPDFPQEATFFSANVWDRIGGLRTDLHNVMDVLFYHQVLCHTKNGAFTSVPISTMNVHAGMKTKSAADRRREEHEAIKREFLLSGLPEQLFYRLMRTRWHDRVWGLWRLIGPPLISHRFKKAHCDHLTHEWSLVPFPG